MLEALKDMVTRQVSACKDEALLDLIYKMMIMEGPR